MPRSKNFLVPRRGLLGSVLALLTIIFIAALSGLRAQGAATGIIEGRILNAASGDYLNNARIVVEGATTETSSNEIGYYKLPGVPAGETKIRVSFEGMQPESAIVRVTSGEIARHDFSLTLLGRPSDNPTVLEAFTVTERQMTGQAVAEQERRNSPNIKGVVSTAEFGDMGEGNVGEFMKYIPGVSTAYSGGQTPQSVSLRGMPYSSTIVMTDGAEMGSSQTGTRSFDLQTSANGVVDRIEVSKVPTPDMPANAVGGTVNIINKSGFSRATPLFTYQFFLTSNPVGSLRNVDTSLHTRKGDPPQTNVAPTRPAYNLSYILPLNKRLAFTFTLSHAQRADEWVWLFTPWDRIALLQTQNRPGRLINSVETQLAAASVEWKVTDNQILRASFQSSSTITFAERFQLLATAGAGAIGDRTFTQGTAAAVGNVAQQPTAATRGEKTLQHVTLSYRYDGSLWNVDGNLVFSRGGLDMSDTNNGFFNSVTTSLPNLIVRFDGLDAITQGNIAAVTATDRTGKPVNINDGNNYSVTAVSSSPSSLTDVVRRAGVNVRRKFATRLPFEIKVGSQVNRRTNDASGGAYSMSFAPPGGAAAQLAGNWDFIATDFSARTNFTDANGKQVNVQWISPYKVYELYKTHPEYFTYSAANETNRYTSLVNTSKYLQETIVADYLRFDTKLINNRLWIVAGVRYEQTTDYGEGPLNDIGRTYQRNAAGALILDAAGRPIPITTDTLARAKLQLVSRGSHSDKRYDGLFPSLNATFNVTPRFLVRAGFAQTIGRPELSQIIPGVTITDPTSTAAAKTITIVNSGLKPWTANNYDLSFELYGAKGASASVSLFRKELKNFFGSVRTAATPQLLAEFGLAESYDGYDVVTTRNFGAATLQGVEFGYRQSLDPYLPSALRGLQFFYNVTSLDVSGPNANDFTTLAPRTITWGVSFNRPRYSLGINVLQNKWVRGAPSAPSGMVPAGAYAFTAPETKIDVSGEYRFSKRLSIYSSIRNVNHSVKRSGIRGPGIPDYAKIDFYQFSDAMITLGIKGQF